MIGLNTQNFKTVSLPSAVTDLSSLLQLLNDKKLFEKHLTKLVNLTNEANEAIENVGKAKEIQNLLIEAEQINTKAKEGQQAAQDKADQIISDAESRSKLLYSNAQANADKLVNDAEIKLQDAKQDWNDALVSKTANEKLESELKDKEINLNKRENALQKVEREIEKKKELLAQL